MSDFSTKSRNLKEDKDKDKDKDEDKGKDEEESKEVSDKSLNPMPSVSLLPVQSSVQPFPWLTG